MPHNLDYRAPAPPRHTYQPPVQTYHAPVPPAETYHAPAPAPRSVETYHPPVQTYRVVMFGFRVAEFDILKAHCDRKSVHVQSARPIDNEIVFINYRLASRKLGLRYVAQETDTSSSLLRRGIWLALTETTQWRTAASHIVWFTALFLSPSWLAYRLIMLRFNRAELLRPLLRFGSVIRRKHA